VFSVSCGREEVAVPARAAGVWLSITALARREGAAVAVRHAVIACAQACGAGASLSVAADHRPYEPLFATDARSDELAELQSTLGEGPAIDAGQGNGPVLAPDLALPEAQARWPEFAAVTLARGVAAIFAVPVGSGAARLGVLCLCREQAGALARDQLGISLTDALVTLRARAYAQARPISQVAADVVGRRLSFTGQLPNFPQPAAQGQTGAETNGDGSASPPRGPAPPRQQSARSAAMRWSPNSSRSP